jgi:ribosome recycling factor
MDSIINQFDVDFKENEERLKKEFSSIHTGRATPALIDNVYISAYGQNQPIKNVASINIEDVKTLRVAPWDKGQIKEIEKAILVSNLGLSVSSDEAGIRVIVPQLTGENREKLVKVLKQKLEDARISVRQIREKAVKEVEQAEKDKKISEDQRKALKDKVQKKVDTANEALEGLFALKEKEVLGN